MPGGMKELGHLSSEQKKKEYVLFLGNSGVGKSAICNALGATCESATQGNAVTSMHSLHEVHLQGKEVVLIDAPGLYEANETNVKRNIEEISAALQYGGKYRLIFVICLQGGRLQYGDAAVMKCISPAVKRAKGPIGLIVNKLVKDEMEMLKDPEEQAILKRGIQVACGADVETETSDSNCEIELFKLPLGGLGNKWDLTKWLLSLMSVNIISVEKIRTLADIDAEKFNEKLKEALARKEQQATSEAQASRSETNEFLREERIPTPKPLVTRVTHKNHLPTEPNSGELVNIFALFPEQKELVEIHVNKETFERCKVRGVQYELSYWFSSLFVLYLNVAVSAMINSNALEINSRRMEGMKYEPVVKIESIIEGRTTHDSNKFVVDEGVYDNTNRKVDRMVDLSEYNSTEMTVSHTLGAEVGLEEMHSMLSDCNMTLPNRKGSEQLSDTCCLPAGSKVVIQKWRKEDIWTTHYSTLTYYDGFAMWCDRRGDKIAMPATSLWPSRLRDWQVTQKQISRWAVVHHGSSVQQDARDGFASTSQGSRGL